MTLGDFGEMKAERDRLKNLAYKQADVIEQLQAAQARLRAAFRINAIRDHPELSHGDIDAEIERIVCGDEQSAPTKHKIDWSTEPNPNGYPSGDYKPPIGCDAVGRPIDPDKQRGQT